MSTSNRLRATLLIVALSSLVALPLAANVNDEFPPNAEPGRCYAKCVIPATYENYSEQMLAQDAATRLEAVPASWEEASERVLIAEESKKLTVIPAVYETVEETVMVKPASSRLETVAAVYDTVTETIETAPATTRWEKRDSDQACFSDNPEDCRVWCLVDVPAVTRTVSKRVLRTPATTRTIEIPAEYRTVKRRVVKTPAQVTETVVPAQYDTITKWVMTSPASTRTIEIPAEYQTVTRTRLSSAVGATDWREVMCAADITSDRVRQIQRALRDRGFDPGPIDNIIGRQTRAALLAFQRANNLPEGSLDVETLAALGIDYR